MLLQNSLNKRFVSKNGLDIVEKAEQYFNSYSLATGVVNYKGISYNLKKIELDEEYKSADLPEVKLIDGNAKSPYLLKYIDYIIEQEEINGSWQEKAIYILMETSDYDLKAYVNKFGQLCLDDLLVLFEVLIGANYYLEKHLKMAHGEISPHNVRIILPEGKPAQQSRPLFKLSFFEIPFTSKEHRACSRRFRIPYMAPELLCSPALTSTYASHKLRYIPSQELQTLITECPDEIRYDVSRADVFSTGLTLFSAATNIFFGLAWASNTYEAPRDGPKEVYLVNQHLKTLKSQLKCDGLVEIMRIMLTHNPLVRYDFQELALRIAQLNARDSRIPKVREEAEVENLEEEHKVLKGKYLELQNYAVRMREREHEYQNIINQLKEQLDYQFEGNEINTRKTLDIEEQPIEYLNEMSSIASIMEENTSFLSPTLRKDSGLTDSLKKSDSVDTRATSKNADSQLRDSKELSGPKRQMSTNDAYEQQKARHKNSKINQGQLTHLEIKNSIIRRREISDTRVVS